MDGGSIPPSSTNMPSDQGKCARNNGGRNPQLRSNTHGNRPERLTCKRVGLLPDFYPGGDSGVATPAQRADRHPAGTAACPEHGPPRPGVTGRGGPPGGRVRRPAHQPTGLSAAAQGPPIHAEALVARAGPRVPGVPGRAPALPAVGVPAGVGTSHRELVWLRWRRTIRAGESQAIPPSVVHSVDVPDGAVLSVDFLTRPWRHQEAPPGGATWRWRTT